MLNAKSINTAVTTLGFDLELSDKATRFNYRNPYAIARWIEDIKDKFKSEIATSETSQRAIADLEKILAEHQELKVSVSSDDLKKVYEMLKNRKLHPEGEFDKMVVFILKIMSL